MLGTLAVTIADLPAGASANVTITYPDGAQTTISSSQILPAIPGTYSIVAAPVAAGTSTYNALLQTQSALVTSGASTTVVVDYKNVVPGTTKVLDSVALTSLSVSSDGTTLSMSSSSPVAQSLAAGNVVVVPPTPAAGAAPKGMLRKVVSISSGNSQIVLATQKATLSDAFQRVAFQIQTQLTSAKIQAVHTSPGVVFRSGAFLRKPLRQIHAQDSGTMPTDPCGGYSLGVFDVTEPIQSSPVAGLTLSGSVEVCSGLNFGVDIIGTGFLNLTPTVNSLTATASMGEYANLTLEGEFLAGSFAPDPTPLATLEFAPIEVPGLPVWVTPEVTVFVGAKGSISSSVSTEVSEAGTFAGGVNYASGVWSPVPLTPSFQFGYAPPTLNASMSAKAYAGIEFDLDVYDVVGPSFKPDGYLDLEADISQNPWWTLNAGIEGPMSLDVTFLGEDLASYDLGTLFNYSTTIASATGPFTPPANNPVPSISSLSPASLQAGATPGTLTINGTGFLPSSSVTLNGVGHAAAFISASQLTIALTAADLATAGSYPVVVTNPAPGGGSSAAVNFVVSAANPLPTITSLSLTSLAVGATSQTLTINGTGFLPTSTVTLNGIGHLAAYVSASQLTTSLTAADLATASSFSVVVTNPGPGGGSSAPVSFSVSPNNPVPSITSLLPASLQVGAAPQTLTINGTAFMPSSTVTFNGNGSASTFVSASELTIQLTQQDLATVGSYLVVVTNPAPGGGKATADFIVTAPANNPVPTITQLNPPSLAAGAAPQTLTIDGTGFLPSSTVTFNSASNAATFVSSSQLTISLTASDLTTAGAYPVVVTNPAPGGGSSGPATFDVTAAVADITISPSSVKVPVNAVQTFSAIVPGGGSANWSIREGSAGGSITAAGVYTAPGAIGTYHVVVANSTNSGQTATATVSVVAAVPYSVLYSFPFAFESAGLIQGVDGDFYGTNEMIAFKIDSSGNFTQLAGLSSSPDAPISPLIQASDGNFYGTMSEGGADGLGSIFKMNPSDQITTLYSFEYTNPGATNGAWPWAGLIQGKDGNFYGTTYAGGSITCSPYGYGVPAYGPYGYGNPPWIYESGCGTIFKMDSSGNLTVLYSFSGQSDGNFPQAPLIQGNDGNFYGTTSAGGANHYGTVFKMDSSGNLTVLHSLGYADGGGPVAALLQGTDGNLYGTTTSFSSGGEVFKLDTAGNNFTVLHTFSGPDGWSPVAPLIQDKAGNFYGTTWAGGDETCGSWYWEVGSEYPYDRAAGCGAVFKMDLSGNVTVLHAFEEPQGGEGNDPYAGLVQGKDGFLYGTTYYGGASIYFGTIFKIGLPAN
jgi:uncharacterized repeat protein (TIGR03803 family)